MSYARPAHGVRTSLLLIVGGGFVLVGAALIAEFGYYLWRHWDDPLKTRRVSTYVLYQLTDENERVPQLLEYDRDGNQIRASNELLGVDQPLNAEARAGGEIVPSGHVLQQVIRTVPEDTTDYNRVMYWVRNYGPMIALITLLGLSMLVIALRRRFVVTATVAVVGILTDPFAD